LKADYHRGPVRDDAPAVRRLYDFLDSGNGYKVRLALAQLGIPCDWVAVDILAGETRRPAFLEKNPNGRIPLLELADGSYLAESNAILCYLAERTPLLADDSIERARMFFEQYSHEPYIAVARFWCRHPEVSHFSPAELEHKREGGRAALEVMEQHLARRDFFVGGRYSVADIALFAYTHVADQAGIDPSDYPSVSGWLRRVASEPGHVPIGQIPNTTS
jgi:glutathione S-transferase